MKKLTRIEKILLGVSIVGIGVTGYFGYKCYINININIISILILILIILKTG